ncbi:MAG TPA: SPOR domain-containing protein [Steroidobacteraceae bacterium]|nr:SPOR domain-containing protein [Steroidobacteraceae bacterium]
MESRAKQRLTGAIIVVALFVLLVPELLTGPRDAQPAAASGDEGLRRYTIDLDAPGTAPPASTAAQDAPVNLPPVTPVDAAPSSADSNDESAPNRDAAASARPSAPAPSVGPASPATRPAPAEPAPKVEPRAPPASSAPAATAPARGNFVVQLGSFGSRDNAERLVRDMKAKGFTAFIAPITSQGRELYRVRVGPTRDRASAEALASQLKRAGQSGSIVPIS